jgi:hypothetical protein
MQLLTFEELVVMAEQRRDKARTPDSVEGWDRLLDVARALAGPGGSTNDLTSGRTWKLVHTRIEGYQGVGWTSPSTRPPV